jgi:glycosyltransferase involved in cell wall biosynthesis
MSRTCRHISEAAQPSSRAVPAPRRRRSAAARRRCHGRPETCRARGYVGGVSSPSREPSSVARPRVLILRGHQANPWELRPWTQRAISERFDVSYLRSRRGWFDTDSLALRGRPTWTMRDLLPAGRLGDMAVRIPGDRYLGLRAALRGADIVHAQELGYWYSMQAARLKQRIGFRLVLTVWETIPFLDAYRNVRTRAYRALTLTQTDLFLASTERARASLLLEGVPPERIRVSAPGVDTGRFSGGEESTPAPSATVILSAGRLVWEKGHQDVLRALALLRRREPRPSANVRLRIVGRGPEESRLRAYARELGVDDAVEFCGFIAYEQMPAAYREAACIVLASLPTWSWEEQFGMVLAEALAAGVPILASSSGAIPEVAGDAARYFSPGDWVGLAEALRERLQLGREPAGGATAGSGERYSAESAAVRLVDAYDELLSDDGEAGPTPSSSS